MKDILDYSKKLKFSTVLLRSLSVSGQELLIKHLHPLFLWGIDYDFLAAVIDRAQSSRPTSQGYGKGSCSSR